MFSLLAGLLDYYLFNRQREYNILIVGVEKAGKTTLLEQVKVLISRPRESATQSGEESSSSESAVEAAAARLPKILPTVGLNIARVTVNEAKLTLWDLGGSSNLRGIWEKYYSDAHAVLFLVDSSDLSRMADSRRTLRALARNKDLEGAPLLVAVNKQDKLVAAENGGEGGDEDVVGYYTTADVLVEFGLDEMAAEKEGPVRVQPTSAITGEGLFEGLRWLIAAIVESPRTRSLTWRQQQRKQEQTLGRKSHLPL